jgi:hypothetical protein
MYVAHLHFEIRKNLHIGINRSAYPRDLMNYYRPNEFIASHRRLSGSGRSAMIITNTYNIGKTLAPPSDESAIRKTAKPEPVKPPTAAKKHFQVNRFEDLGPY